MQVLVSEMIGAWGPEGLEAHARAMQVSYARRAQVVLAAAGARGWVRAWGFAGWRRVMGAEAQSPDS